MIRWWRSRQNIPSKDRWGISEIKTSGPLKNKGRRLSPEAAENITGVFNLNQALKTLEGKKALLICLHDDPDPDALAAGWGLSFVLAEALCIQTTLGFNGIIGRAENRAMVQELGIPVKRIRSLNISRFDGVFLVDTQPAAENHSVPDELPILGCIDHHPVLGHKSAIPWFDVRPNGETCSAIVLQYLLSLEIEVHPDLATAILYGIKTDTRDLSRQATPPDLLAYTYVLSRANLPALGAIVNPRLDPVYFQMLHRALDAACLYEHVTVLFLGDLPYPDLVAEMADLFVRRREMHWCLCGGVYNRFLRFSLRTETDRPNAGEVARNLVRRRNGSAGGHDMIAGGYLPMAQQNLSAAGLWNVLVQEFLKAVEAGPALDS